MEREEWQVDIRIIRTWITVIVTVRGIRRRSRAEDSGKLKIWKLNGSFRRAPSITVRRNKWDPLSLYKRGPIRV